MRPTLRASLAKDAKSCPTYPRDLFHNSRVYISRVCDSLKITSGHPQCLSAGAIPHPRAGSLVSSLYLWSTCISGYLQKNNVAKGDWYGRYGRNGVRETCRKGEVERNGRKCTSARTRVDLFLGTASRLFPPSLRNQAVHHVSPFFLHLLAVTSYTRDTGCLKTDRY